MSKVFEISYKQKGTSVNTNELGMREMQAKVYAKRTKQHLLVKAPPASGKSRALMLSTCVHLTNPLNLPALGRRQPLYISFRFSRDLCFC